jgi:hypothetical protein
MCIDKNMCLLVSSYQEYCLFKFWLVQLRGCSLMAKSLFASVVPACTLSTQPEDKRRTLLPQAFASVQQHGKRKCLIYTKW